SESAPPEHATPYSPGPTRPICALTAAMRRSTGGVVVMSASNLPMSERDVSSSPPGSGALGIAPLGPLDRIRAQLAGPRGYRRIDALLSQEDAAGAIAALSPGEMFELVHEVGF